MMRRLLSILVLFFSLPLAFAGSHFSWLGPEGGDARSLAYDPAHPDHIFLGTMAGKLFFSSDNGGHWARLARLGGDDYVLDSIAIDPADSHRIYVAGWSLGPDTGDLFRSTDGGKTWDALPGVHGKSLRALALAPSNPREVVAVALDGVYRSRDGGDSWERISPAGSGEIKNLQSVAIDPTNPDVIYVGTWHLPWKTTDGGKTWGSIKKGLIDDSDVFSINIEHGDPQVVFASACSGIYKSENGGALFQKVLGMPFSARRTRVILSDDANPAVVYAGTTEGLWKSLDAGHSFHRTTPPNVVVNGIVIDPRRPEHLLLATDRGGVLVSEDGGQSFADANHGFSQRQVAALLVDGSDDSTLYAGLINDKEYGGVFVSHDGGRHWQQMSAGLDGRDIFTLQQTATGALVAGTNRGIFEWQSGGYRWQPINNIVLERERRVRQGGKLRPAAYRKTVTRSELEARVNALAVSGGTWYAATPQGLLLSENQGQSWHGGAVAGLTNFIALGVAGKEVIAAGPNGVAVSLDGGKGWYSANLPAYITEVFDAAVGPQETLWVATREGAFRSSTYGDSWEHVLAGLPAMHINSITYDRAQDRLYATSMASHALYQSLDDGRHWQRTGNPDWQVRGVAPGHGRLFLTTAYDGVLSEAEEGTNSGANPAGEP